MRVPPEATGPRSTRPAVAEPQATERTLVERFRRLAAEQPQALACAFLAENLDPAAQWTRAELDARASRLAAVLRRRCDSGSRALLLYPPGLEFVAAFLGCVYAGVVPAPAPTPHPARVRASLPRLAGIVRDCGAALVLTTADVVPAVQAACREVHDLAALEWLVTDALDPDAPGEPREPRVSEADLAFLQYTSGSTSTPKGVRVSHANLRANIEAIAARLGLTPDSRGVLWLPHYHDMGLIGGVLSALFVGFPTFLMAPAAFLQRPQRWLQALTRWRGTYSGAPNFAYELCLRRVREDELSRLDLSAWRTAFCGAEPVRAETLEAFARTYEPAGMRWRALTPCYGLAEATLMASSSPYDHDPVIREFETDGLERGVALPAADGRPARRLVACGPVADGHRLAIVDPLSGRERAPHEIGEIWISGPSVAAGYWGREEQSRAEFDARLAEAPQGPGFLRTGDLGFLHEGQLYVAGRLKDLIIVAGANHYPQDIEATVEASHAELRAASCAAFSVQDRHGVERLAVAAEVERSLARVLAHAPDPESDPQLAVVIAAIRRAVSEEHAVHVEHVVLLPPGGIPKTSSGKIQRHACRALLEQRRRGAQEES